MSQMAALWAEVVPGPGMALATAAHEGPTKPGRWFEIPKKDGRGRRSPDAAGNDRPVLSIARDGTGQERTASGRRRIPRLGAGAGAAAAWRMTSSGPGGSSLDRFGQERSLMRSDERQILPAPGMAPVGRTGRAPDESMAP